MSRPPLHSPTACNREPKAPSPCTISGGGTFDLSILKLKNGIFEVLATNGDTHLGGDDFDRVVADLFINEIRDQYGIDMTHYTDYMQSIRLEAEQAKIGLSDEPTTSVMLELPEGKGRYTRELTRDQLELLTRDLVERTLAPCRLALKDAGLTAAGIDEVVLVGGSTRMPLVRRRVQELFGKQPHCELNPDEVVALVSTTSSPSALIQRPQTAGDGLPNHFASSSRVPGPVAGEEAARDLLRGLLGVQRLERLREREAVVLDARSARRGTPPA